MQIIKRNGETVPFNKSKIEVAIIKAMKYGVGYIEEDIAKEVATQIEDYFFVIDETPTIYQVEKLVSKLLSRKDRLDVALAYEGYRATQSFKREVNTTDDSILSLVRGTNAEVMSENSNKNAKSASTQRDLIAGEVSKDISRRRLIPAHIVQAHDEGIIHWHDLDYTLQAIPNCCLINLKDMLDNGTVINGCYVDSPNSFLTACTIATQIMAQVASGQYGGQTTSLSHLAPYIRKSRERYYKLLKDTISSVDELNRTVEELVKKEVASGVQTIQYQIQTLATANGTL